VTEKDILDLIAEKLSDILEIDDPVITRDSSADDFEDWDSINHVRLLISIETALNISFGSGEVGMIENVGQLADLIASKTKSG
jgi:acyl carrier protein